MKPERVPQADALHSLADRGLAPQARDAFADAALAEANALITLVPSLWQVVQQRVQGIALIASSGPDFDTSHSEPSWPGWIFVSVPPESPRRAIRLAEGVIHEAMHHNLSALEKEVALAASALRSYSPWKQEDRAASGLLHGIYVFTCLLSYFRYFVAEVSAASDHARARIGAIRDEIGLIDRVALEDALTPCGRGLCRALYKAIELE